MPAPVIVPAAARLEGDSIHEAGRHRHLSSGGCSCGHLAWSIEHVVREVNQRVVAPAVAELTEQRTR